ncbi:universal stress protein [Natronorubrum sulfidifaciens]|uniref:UspA domain-containing protein n=1 Tax=Natronorubrum sulfidifaciens JCM 14089 TaxID=1230460 RepID=L9WB66_9EURY|nr:UspA domain-containing protein [Natronorubrum sulfidifaciens JCM 14089]
MTRQFCSGPVRWHHTGPLRVEDALEQFPDARLTVLYVVGPMLEDADEHAIDGIVIGSHGREGTARYLLGSVAEQIVRWQRCR